MPLAGWPEKHLRLLNGSRAGTPLPLAISEKCVLTAEPVVGPDENWQRLGAARHPTPKELGADELAASGNPPRRVVAGVFYWPCSSAVGRSTESGCWDVLQ